jgi:hypothetical protein
MTFSHACAGTSDRALDVLESVAAVQAWDAHRIIDLGDAYRALKDSRRPLPHATWRTALAALERYAEALQITECASVERDRVVNTFAHVGLAGIAAGVRKRAQPQLDLG